MVLYITNELGVLWKAIEPPIEVLEENEVTPL